MFTGIVQALGTINLHAKGVLIKAPESFFPLTLGESISVDGVCLTVSGLRDNAFLADVSEETLSKSTLGKKASEGQIVNLEPALRLSDRIGGHLVSGHVDGLGSVISIQELDNSWNLNIRWEDRVFAKYTCSKASISLNGVSLTVSNSQQKQDYFSIAIIPHTWINTSLQYLVEGELINLEADIMAKYAESLLFDKPASKSFDISNEWLKNNGFV